LAWTVEYDPRVEKDLKAIDRAMQREILDYMDARIATDEDPRRFGKPLRHELRGLWRYRVRAWRKGWILPFPSQSAHLIKWLKWKRRQPRKHKVCL
jgi:mRNA interferase RelE/StbE